MGCFFGGGGNGGEDLVLSSCSNCKLKYLGPWYFMVCIIYIKFKLKEEKPNDTLRPLYIFLNAMHLNLRAKGHFDMSNWLFPSIVLLQYKNIFKILPDRFSCSYSKKRATTQFFILQAVNTIHQWEMWWEFHQCPGSCRLWQKFQLLL